MERHLITAQENKMAAISCFSFSLYRMLPPVPPGEDRVPANPNEAPPGIYNSIDDEDFKFKAREQRMVAPQSGIIAEKSKMFIGPAITRRRTLGK